MTTTSFEIVALNVHGCCGAEISCDHRILGASLGGFAMDQVIRSLGVQPASPGWTWMWKWISESEADVPDIGDPPFFLNTVIKYRTAGTTTWTEFVGMTGDIGNLVELWYYYLLQWHVLS